MSLSNPHATLGVSRDCTLAEARAAYTAAVLEAHPDKPGGSPAAFLAVQRAWEAIRDGGRSDAPDGGVPVPLARRAPPRAAEDVQLREMGPAGAADGGEVGSLAHPCRCGGAYVFSPTDARGYHADVLVSCSSCSLVIRVLLSSAPNDRG